MKNTSKVLEKGLLENSNKLAADPSMVIPKCAGEECRKCRWAKIEKKLNKVQRYSDDPDKLVKLASRGDQFVRAYAATISLAAAGKIPYLSSAQLPVGEVSFAVRGTVNKEKLIGMQHFDDPDLRLLAYWDMAREKDLHIYSTDKGLFCSAEGPHAPAEYVDEMLDAIQDMKEDGSCGHQGSCITIEWLSAKKTLRICRECAGDANTVTDLSSRIAAPDHSDDFKADAEIKLNCSQPDCERCKKKADISDISERYRKGGMSDAAYLDEAEVRFRQGLKKAGGVFVAGNDCYGTDAGAFMAAMKGSDLERDVLSRLIASKNLFIVSDGNLSGKAITELWPEHRAAMLSFVASEDVAVKLADSKDTPPLILAEARRLELTKNVDKSLPTYQKLGEIGKAADSLARTFKTEGKDAMLRAMERFKGRDHRVKSICYAFSRAAGETSKAWQFTKQEADFGEYLEQFAKAMLENVGPEYDEALENILAASGSNETVA
ncbi:MAG: hypothetical protein WC375_01265 [Methanomassiliicoccales archaeon]